jgi:hypothetical protein
MKWRSNDYRGENQGLEVDSKVWERVKLWELTGKGQAFKTDKQKTNKAKQKQKGLFPLTTGQSQIHFHFFLRIWNFRHNNST